VPDPIYLPARMPGVGDELREAPEAAGLTQEESGGKARIHRTYVSLLEREIESPTLAVFLRICRACDVFAADLIGGSKSRNRNRAHAGERAWGGGQNLTPSVAGRR
jgi:transcriptional regulator with XRE-family HTH domain